MVCFIYFFFFTEKLKYIKAIYYLNIYFVGDENDFLIDKLKLNLESYLNLSSLYINNVIIQISWITKSLSLKSHKKMLQWIDWVFKHNNFLTDLC